MTINYNKKIILENGQEFYGFSFGYDEDKVCEIVFNTSMVGYQEILSDPSYTNQAVVMTYPLIGNYGMAKDDYHKTRTLCDEESEISIAKEKQVYTLIYKLQEEVHRFTISKMRSSKEKTLKKSILEEIDGIGKEKAKKILLHFKSR